MILSASSPSAAAVVHIGKYDLELVAAQAADFAPGEHDMVEPVRHLLEQLVARLMAKRVVDLLEAVEVEHHHGQAALG